MKRLMLLGTLVLGLATFGAVSTAEAGGWGHGHRGHHGHYNRGHGHHGHHYRQGHRGHNHWGHRHHRHYNHSYSRWNRGGSYHRPYYGSGFRYSSPQLGIRIGW